MSVAETSVPQDASAGNAAGCLASAVGIGLVCVLLYVGSVVLVGGTGQSIVGSVIYLSSGFAVIVSMVVPVPASGSRRLILYLALWAVLLAILIGGNS